MDGLDPALADVAIGEPVEVERLLATIGHGEPERGLGGIDSGDGDDHAVAAIGALGLGEAASQGRAAAWNALNRTSGSNAAQSPDNDGVPTWARAMRGQQTARHHRQIALHTLQQGDRGGASATPDIKERD
ncbi:MAG: hypothetical protein ABI240_01190 [Sphingomonas sp.]